MAEDVYRQMYCCLACCAPFTPSKEALRANSMSAKALYYIEGQVVAKRSEWNCTDDPVLITEVNESHLFHRTNILPVLEEFFYRSLKETYLDDDLNHGGAIHSGINTIINTPYGPGQMALWPTVLRISGNTYTAVHWQGPNGIPQMDQFHNVVRNVWRRNNNNINFVPSLDFAPPICKACNDIMTQQGTTSHLLVRTRLTANPLVALNTIDSCRIRKNAGNVRITGALMHTPNNQNKDTKDFHYQACVAYAIHRCMPDRNFVPNDPNLNDDDEAHQLFAVFGFLILEIMSLMVESNYGKDGGATRLVKPKFRYRGVTELYISFLIYILLKNDVPEGEPNGSPIPACTMDFSLFHRYFFNSFIDAIVVAFPDYAHVMHITDVIFTQNWMQAGLVPYVPGVNMSNADQVMGYIAASIARFYEGIVRPYFSRHVAGLLPNPALAVPATEGQYLSQITIYNMIITAPDLTNLINLCDRAVEGNTDSFVNIVGVHAVLEPFDKMLKSAPQRAARLLESFMDSVTLREYRHIMKSLNVKDQSAEIIYLECYALDTPNDPRDQDELALLKQAPKCTAAKAALRLIQCGAFTDEEEDTYNS
jgi:hypothetical protein